MVRLVNQEWGFTTAKEELIALEAEVISRLDWDLLIPSPVFFLERYQRIFGLDQEKEEHDSHRVGQLAKKMMRSALLHSSSLKFKPSQIAAAALLLSINISSSPAAQQVGLPARLTNLRSKAFYNSAMIP
jgi:hypothetical protein